MSSLTRFKFVFYCPVQFTQPILSHLFTLPNVGAIGAYDSCAFVSRGTGQFRPLQGANPTIGQVGLLEFVEEDRVEFLVTGEKEQLKQVVSELRKVHPYEEPAYEAHRLEDI